MIKAIIVPVEGPIREEEVPDDSLKFLQGAVGGWIEAVSVPDFVSGAGEATAYVNEEGKLEGLPINRRATDFFVPGVGLMWGDYIAGDCVFVGFDPKTGEHTDTIPTGVRWRIQKIADEAS